MPELIKPASKNDIDLYASLALQRTAIKKSMEALRPAIEALGEGSHAGFLHGVTVAKVQTSKLSVAIAKSLMSPAEIAQATISSMVTRITVDH